MEFKVTSRKIDDLMAVVNNPVCSELSTTKKYGKNENSEDLERLNRMVRIWNVCRDPEMIEPIWAFCDYIMENVISYCEVSKMEVILIMANIAKLSKEKFLKLQSCYFNNLGEC